MVMGAGVVFRIATDMAWAICDGEASWAETNCMGLRVSLGGRVAVTVAVGMGGN